MEIESISHKGLRRFFETGNAKGLVGDISRLRKMLAFIDAAESLDELTVPPNHSLHPLIGERAGTWSMTVTKNSRLTFRLNEQGQHCRRASGRFPSGDQRPSEWEVWAHRGDGDPL
ncbi:MULTISPECIES: type II toxin-antitoxin system RelE/ParE family toxin [Asaia]|nr:type II toxin-antitoxin system RelE/ParE family toxin [Asaia sp. HumB]MDL2169725.1 type II toxin-antitoxin system RelE/ParE family toxin [Asaia sp. HumB]